MTDGNHRGTRRFTQELGPPSCLPTLPTWTTERLELLKGHFAAGLTCREIAAEIGVSRNAVIGKLSRLGLTRGKPGARAPREQAAQERRGRSVPRLQYRDAARGLRRRGRSRRRRSRASTAARCSNSARSAAAGRSTRKPRNSAFAATRRWRACPIARATRGSPIVHGRGGPARGPAADTGNRRLAR